MRARIFPELSAGRRILTGLVCACLWATVAVAATPAEVQTLMKEGQLQAALELTDDSLEKNADDIEMRFLKGVILTRLERFDAAEKEFQTLTEKHPKLPEPYNNLAVVYAAQGEYEKARETLLSAINTHPSYATAYENIGDIYAKMASDAYNQALQLDTENTAAREKLALVNDLFSAEQGGASTMAAVAAPESEAAPEDTTAAAAEPKPAKPASEMPGPVMTEPKLDDSEAAEPAQPAQQKEQEKQQVAATEPERERGKKQPDTREIVQAVRDWATAWSSQDVQAYLGFYAESFLPPAGMTRQEWSEQRRERLTAPEYIRVDVDNIRVNTLDADHAQVRFSQAYESNTYSDNVIKTLLMKQVGDRWLIAEEHSG